MKKIIIALSVITILYACKTKDAAPTPTPTPPVVTIPSQKLLNVAYGTDAKQVMDIYLPAGRSVASTNMVVIIHGGGWTSGDKSDMNPFVDSIKRRLPTYAIANISYRLSSGSANQFPTQENDVNNAILFLNSKKQEYLFGKSFSYIGVSAGGHLAMLQGYKNNTVVKPNALAIFYGPSNMVEMHNNPVNNNLFIRQAIANLFGNKTPLQEPAPYASGSPVNYINAGDPATILFHGGADLLVAETESTNVRDKLNIAGVTNSYKFYPGKEHGWTDGPTLNLNFNEIELFFKTHQP